MVELRWHILQTISTPSLVIFIDLLATYTNFVTYIVIATHDRRRIPITNPKYESSNSKKRSRKVKSGHAKNGELGDESDGNEFVIVSLDNKQWHFNAINTEEREEWISAIEQQIFSSLQNSEYDKSKLHNVTSVDESIIHSIRTVPGNKYCVDCDAPSAFSVHF